METQKITIPKDCTGITLQFEFEKEEKTCLSCRHGRKNSGKLCDKKCIDNCSFELIELNMEALLEEAKKCYPIGTYVESLAKPYKDTVKHHKLAYKYEDGEIWFEGQDKYNLLIYSNGKWAEIISLPRKVTDLKKGEWIKYVSSIQDEKFTTNKLYKLLRDFDERPFLVIDNKNIPNGYGGCNYKNFAIPSQEEIEAHEESLKPKFKIGDFVKGESGKIYPVVKDAGPDSLTDKMANGMYKEQPLYELSTLEEFQEYLKQYNKKWNPDKFELEDLSVLEALKKGDAYMKKDDRYVFFGVFDELFKDEMRSQVFICADKIIEVNYLHSHIGDYVKITQDSFNIELANLNKKWNFETNILESLDEFTHLPQKVEDLNTSMEGLKISEIQEKFKNYPSINKYSEAIQVQPNLLRMYEAWTSENENGVNYAWRIVLGDKLKVTSRGDGFSLFAFKTEKKAERFLELFRKELELYKPLMGGN